MNKNFLAVIALVIAVLLVAAGIYLHLLEAGADKVQAHELAQWAAAAIVSGAAAIMTAGYLGIDYLNSKTYRGN